MGLFDNLGQTQPAPASGSLFGGTPAAASATTPAKPLFSLGQPPQSGAAPSAGGGLFGASTAASSAPASGGLFGAPAAASQPQQQSTGLFGSLAKPPQQSAATGGGSTLFGGLGASTQPTQQSGLLGGSLLSGLGQPQQLAAPSQQADPNAQSKSASTLQAAYFDQILERGKKRNNHDNGIGGLGDLPTLQLGLGDIARKVRNLGQGGPSAVKGKINDSRA